MSIVLKFWTTLSPIWFLLYWYTNPVTKSLLTILTSYKMSLGNVGIRLRGMTIKWLVKFLTWLEREPRHKTALMVWNQKLYSPNDLGYISEQKEKKNNKNREKSRKWFLMIFCCIPIAVCSPVVLRRASSNNWQEQMQRAAASNH